MSQMLTLRPVAHIETDFKDKFGIPRQSGRVKTLVGRIVFEEEFRDPEALREIEGFSHLWLIFDFSESHRDGFSPTVRPPRLGGNRRIGVFASRSPYRPNPLGLSVVKLERVEHTAHEGVVLHVSGVDLLDGTPIYDIKPYLPFADAIPDALGGYAAQHEGHRLKVEVTQEQLSVFPEEKRRALCDCLAEDPRPAYQDDARVYKLRFAECEVAFTVEGETLRVQSIERK
ncbi:MAG: tRNA (N6-threonylcarbamoyladenosine(37)-N6)-methyltransferase TrmO [Clostridia bacterium]|nr:tRNA (N6-threonylcarbamoyladenosine(37)-N6)-methyltransferase TrmO [Clostridia bacterium]